jgi:hypothetical protein
VLTGRHQAGRLVVVVVGAVVVVAGAVVLVVVGAVVVVVATVVPLDALTTAAVDVVLEPAVPSPVEHAPPSRPAAARMHPKPAHFLPGGMTSGYCGSGTVPGPFPVLLTGPRRAVVFALMLHVGPKRNRCRRTS